MSGLRFSLIIGAVDRVSGVARRVASVIEGIVGAARRAGQATRGIGQGAFAAMARLGQGGFAVSANLNQAAEGMSRFTGQARRLLAGPIGAAADFEQAMSDVVAVTQNAHGENLQLLIDKARELGAETRYSATEAAQGMKFLGQAGHDTVAILDEMASVLALATAGNLELGRAADIGTDIMGAFALKGEGSFKRVADVLADTANSATTDVNQLAEALSYSATVAHQAGWSLEELATLTGLMADAGIKGSRAGTAMNAMIGRMANPKVLKQLKINPFDAAGDMKRPLVLLQEIAGVLGKLPKGKQLAVGIRLFGQEAAPAALKLLADAKGDGISEALAARSRATDGVGAAAKMAAIRADNFRGSTVALSSAIESLNIRVGNVLLPHLRELVDGHLRPAVGWIERWTAAHPRLTKLVLASVAALVALGAVLVPLMLAASAVATMLGVLGAAFGTTKTGAQLLGGAIRWVVVHLWRLAVAIVTRALPALASFIVHTVRLGVVLVTRAVVAVASFAASLVSMAISAIAAAVPALVALTIKVLAFGAALMATPVGWIIAGIALLIGAAVILYRNWDRVRAFWAKWGTAVKLALVMSFGPIGWVIAAAGTLIARWTPAREFFASLGQSISSSFTTAWTWIKDGAREAVDTVRGYFAPLLDALAAFGVGTEVEATTRSIVEKVDGGGAQDAGAGLQSTLDSRQRFDGVLKIEIDADGRPRVRDLRGRGPIDVELDAGRLMSF